MYFDFQFRCSKRCSVSIAALAVHVPVATSIPNFRTGRTSFGCPTSAFRTRPRSSITLYSTVGIHAVIIKKSICGAPPGFRRLRALCEIEEECG